VVVGISSMINMVISKLGETIPKAFPGGDVGGMSTMAQTVSQMFSDGIPTYYLQIVVGIYVVQIVYVLTVLSNGVENGSDKLSEEYYVAKNLKSSTILYCIIAGVVMLIFAMVTNTILSNMNLGEALA
jgi:hypothetical protein